MIERDECFRITHSKRAASEAQTTRVELILFWLKEGLILLLILLAIYPFLEASVK
jgi:hypothetical protein